MTEIQKYQQPTREALQVVARGRNLQGIGQQEVAAISVYGSYIAVDNHDSGYSVAVVPPEDARRLQDKPPALPANYWMGTTMAELTGTIGVIVYGIADSISHSAGGVEGPMPVTDMLIGMGGLALGGVGAAAARTKRVRQYRRSITQACKVANQNFIPNRPATFPELSPEAQVPYGQGREVAYDELWSTIAALQQEISNPKPEEKLPDRQLHAANLMRGMVSNFWGDDERKEFLCAAMEPWTELKSNLERLRVYEGVVDVSDSLKKVHEPQVLRTASNIAGIVASFLDTRGIELHASANQQLSRADTQHAVDADQEVVNLLTAQGVISRARADVVLSVDAAYRQG